MRSLLLDRPLAVCPVGDMTVAAAAAAAALTCSMDMNLLLSFGQQGTTEEALLLRLESLGL